MFKAWLAAVFLATLHGDAFVAADEWDSQVDAIMANVTTLDIVGQMTQIAAYGIVNSTYQLDEDAMREYAKLHVGSYLSDPMINYGEVDGVWGWTTAQMRAFVTRIQEIAMEENGRHPMIYGIDAVHGNALLTDTVFFGQQINGAASFNPDLVYQQGIITARDTLAAGISWISGPTLDISHNKLWPRTYEHWIAYSWNPTGHDKDGVVMADFDLLNTFVPSFKAAVDAGVLTGMENYISVNGVPVVDNTKLLKTLLRNDVEFDGMMVTDFSEINALESFHRVARDTENCVKLQKTTMLQSKAFVFEDPYLQGRVPCAKI